MGTFQQPDVEFVNADFTKTAELVFESVSPPPNASVASAEAAVSGSGGQLGGELKAPLPGSGINPPLGLLS